MGQKITFDGTEYDFDSLPEKARNQINNLRATEQYKKDTHISEHKTHRVVHCLQVIRLSAVFF